MNRVVPDNAQYLGVRDEQEDSFGFSMFDNEMVIEKRGCLAIIADGMGGLELGREVSQSAVQTFLHAYQDLSQENSIPNLLYSSLLEANRVVLDLATEHGVKNQAGTTLIAATILGSSLYWISVGDSRIYLFRNGELVQLTEDHVYRKLLHEEVTKGNMTMEEAENHPQKDGLISFLGIEDLPEIDLNVKPFPLEPDDRVLLCSDGVYGYLTEEEMISILTENKTKAPQALIDRLIAKKHPFQDNATVAILHYEEAPSRKESHSLAIPTRKQSEPLKKATPNKTNRKRMIIVSVLLTILIGCGIYLGYEYIVKTGKFQEIINSDWNPFKKDEENIEKLNKEGDGKP